VYNYPPLLSSSFILQSHLRGGNVSFREDIHITEIKTLVAMGRSYRSRISVAVPSASQVVHGRPDAAGTMGRPTWWGISWDELRT
jgi:hypothetical protein